MSHQKMSRPPRRCGNGTWRAPIERCTLRDAAADDEHSSVRDVTGAAVTGAVHLHDVRRQIPGDRRDVRDLESPRRDHDLLSRHHAAVGELDAEATVLGTDGAHLAVQLDG